MSAENESCFGAKHCFFRFLKTFFSVMICIYEPCTISSGMFYENKCGRFEFHVYLKGIFCLFPLSLCDLFPADAEEATERLVPAL